MENPDLWKREGNYYRNSLNTAHAYAKLALEYADALIYEFDKRLSNDNTRK